MNSFMNVRERQEEAEYTVLSEFASKSRESAGRDRPEDGPCKEKSGGVYFTEDGAILPAKRRKTYEAQRRYDQSGDPHPSG